MQTVSHQVLFPNFPKEATGRHRKFYIVGLVHFQAGGGEMLSQLQARFTFHCSENKMEGLHTFSEDVGRKETCYQKKIIRKQWHKKKKLWRKSLHCLFCLLKLCIFCTEQQLHDIGKLLILQQRYHPSSERFLKVYWIIISNLYKLFGAGVIFYVFVQYLAEGIFTHLAI